MSFANMFNTADQYDALTNISRIADVNNKTLGLVDQTQAAQEFANSQKSSADKIAELSAKMDEPTKASAVQKISAAIAGLGLLAQGLSGNKSIRKRSVDSFGEIGTMIKGQRDAKDKQSRQKYADMIAGLQGQQEAGARGYGAIATATNQANAGKIQALELATGIRNANMSSLNQEANRTAQAKEGAANRAIDLSKFKESIRQFDEQLKFYKDQQGKDGTQSEAAGLIDAATKWADQQPDVVEALKTAAASNDPTDMAKAQAIRRRYITSHLAYSTGQAIPNPSVDPNAWGPAVDTPEARQASRDARNTYVGPPTSAEYRKAYGATMSGY